jgi:hypothetical protein
MEDTDALRELWTELRSELVEGRPVSRGNARAAPCGDTFHVENTKTQAVVTCNSADEAVRCFISLLRQT